MATNNITVSTSKKHEIVDITDELRKIVKGSGIKEGLCNVYVGHATAAIVINENYDPNVGLDLLDALENMVPNGRWRHDRVDNNAAAHIKAAILGPSETIPIRGGRLQLGRWQDVVLVELDGPRSGRNVVVTILEKN